VVLRADAEALGATFIVTPISARELVGAVLQTAYRRDRTQPIRPPFERRRSERRKQRLAFAADRRSGERRQILPWLVIPPDTPTP
jgi:hypothetical protein